jgi:hypothetical protein
MVKHAIGAQKNQFLMELKYNSDRKARQVAGLARKNFDIFRLKKLSVFN